MYQPNRCRLCLNGGFNLKNVFTIKSSVISSFVRSIWSFYKIKISPHDGDSHLICVYCINILESVESAGAKYRKNQLQMHTSLHFQGATTRFDSAKKPIALVSSLKQNVEKKIKTNSIQKKSVVNRATVRLSNNSVKNSTLKFAAKERLKENANGIKLANTMTHKVKESHKSLQTKNVNNIKLQKSTETLSMENTVKVKEEGKVNKNEKVNSRTQKLYHLGTATPRPYPDFIFDSILPSCNFKSSTNGCKNEKVTKKKFCEEELFKKFKRCCTVAHSLTDPKSFTITKPVKPNEKAEESLRIETSKNILPFLPNSENSNWQRRATSYDDVHVLGTNDDSIKNISTDGVSNDIDPLLISSEDQTLTTDECNLPQNFSFLTIVDVQSTENKKKDCNIDSIVSD